MVRYFFEEVSHCEMCGDPTAHHELLGQRLNQSQGFSPRKKRGISVSAMKCSNCGLIYSNPLPVPFDINDHYGLPPEEYWPHEDYFIWMPDYFSRQIKIVKQLLLFKQGMTALDIGAGLGKCMLSLQHAGFDAYGIEASKLFYEAAISKMGIDPEKLKNQMLERAAFPENSFDLISFGAVLEHLYHPAESIGKALRWLKPNGVIQIEVPSSKYIISKLVNAYYRLRGTNYVTHISPMHPPFHLYEFDLKSFEKLGQRLNYQIELHYYDAGVIPDTVPKIFHRSLYWYMKRTNSGMQLTVYLRKRNGI